EIIRCELLINISFVSKGGRGLRCELVIAVCDQLGRNILCTVFCPSEYLENALHAFFMMKKGSGRAFTSILRLKR
ncbi:unnamed protein product, partial [Staurois parvus]